MSDRSSKVRDQNALTTSSGASWLFIGGTLVVICGGLLFAMQQLQPVWAGLTGLLIVLALWRWSSSGSACARDAGASGSSRC
jgi:hypothetical protein